MQFADTMDADNTDNMAGTSQTSDSMMLNYLLKHLCTSDERFVKIASEVNMLSKMLLSALKVQLVCFALTMSLWPTHCQSPLLQH